MKTSLSKCLMLVVLGGFASSAIVARTARPNLPDRIELGRNGEREPCAATRYWGDPALTGYFGDSYKITCRGATAGRSLGIVRSYRIADAAPAERDLQCSAETTFTIPSLGDARARRCADKTLGLNTVVTIFDRGGRRYFVTAIPIVQGPAEEALRILAGTQAPNPDRNRQVAPVVQVAALAAANGAAMETSLAVDPAAALQQGLRYIRQGLHMEASRTLNDAISRLPADAPVEQRVDLLLVAGLADSNLRFFDSANEYFTRADALLLANPGLPDANVLQRKRQSYAALDLLNRREFTRAVGALDALASAPVDPKLPLTDPTVIRAINQTASGAGAGRGGAVAVPDIASLSQLVIDAQANWARSVALLAQDKSDQALTALDAADRSFAVLRREQINQLQVLWLAARLDRQRARILVRQGKNEEGLAAYDRAIAALNRAAVDGSGIGPTLAETQLERAAVSARFDPDRARVLAQFDGAIDSLASSNATGNVLPPSIEQYLDLLVQDSLKNPAGNAGERFFRAIQAVGEPAVARQFNELQTLVTSNPSLASKVQDRSELEREVTRLRFEIANTPAAENAKVASLDVQRADAEAKLIAISSELQSSSAFSAVDDRPATIGEVRSMLRPGEVYFKVSRIFNYAFGILIDGNGYQIYRVARPMMEIKPLSDAVRVSIDGGGAKLPRFNVAASYALFNLLAGPATRRLLAAKTVIVDPSGPMEKIPFGVLVTTKASVDRFAATRDARPYDYTKVDFLARHAALSSALSPRSLLVARKLPESTAPHPFLGFAQHQPITGDMGARLVSIGSSCQVPLKDIALLTNTLSPIDARELVKASAALGFPGAPETIGAAFTDTAVMARTDLDQYQILHFATHGLVEGQWGCTKSPPALVTSLGAEGSDAILSFSEIARLHLDANLIVLSACDTAAGVSQAEARAAGQEETGATLEGLVRAFLAANARAVLTTYWPISDEGESVRLIEEFYRAGRTADIGDALKTAQASLIADPATSHPIYWGAFFVVGDASKTMLSPGTRPTVAPVIAQTAAR